MFPNGHRVPYIPATTVMIHINCILLVSFFLRAYYKLIFYTNVKVLCHSHHNVTKYRQLNFSENYIRFVFIDLFIYYFQCTLLMDKYAVWKRASNLYTLVP
jgi:hypothetical protein